MPSLAVHSAINCTFMLDRLLFCKAASLFPFFFSLGKLNYIYLPTATASQMSQPALSTCVFCLSQFVVVPQFERGKTAFKVSFKCQVLCWNTVIVFPSPPSPGGTDSTVTKLIKHLNNVSVKRSITHNYCVRSSSFLKLDKLIL